MGVTASDDRAPSRVRRLSALFLLLLVVTAALPALASIYGYEYSDQAATVQSPSVSLQPGTAGASTTTLSNSATVTATAGLEFYESANAPTASPALDGSASGTSVSASGTLIQNTYNACASGTTCSKAFASSVASGDIVVVSIEWLGAVSSPSINDGQGGKRCASFTPASGSPVTNTVETAMWYCTTSSAGAMTPTVSWTTQVVSKLDIYETSGFTTTGLTCGTGTGRGTSLAVSSTAFTASSFLVAAYAANSAGTKSETLTAGTGFTLSDTSSANDGGSGEYATAGVASPTTFPATGSVKVDWAGIGCAFPAVVSNSKTLSAVLTTTGTSDVIYVIVGILNSKSQTVLSVTDSSALTYTLRGSQNLGTSVRIETWYAVTSSALSSDTITVGLNSPADAVVIAMGISGADTAFPFDPNLASPSTTSGTGTSASTTVTTAFPNDFLVGVVVSQNSPTFTAGTGFTTVATVSPVTGTVKAGAEYQAVTSLQSSATVSVTLGSSENWVIVADAISAGTSPPSADTSLAAPATSGSITLNPGASAFLWTPAYPAGGTLYGGSWTQDIWESTSAAGTVTASVYVVNSAGGIVGTVLGSGPISLAKSVKAVETVALFSGSGATIPSNGMVLTVYTDPIGGTAVTIYWGTGQLTNFRSPSNYNYVLAIADGVAVSWNISLGVASSTNLGRLSNLTVSFTTAPASDQVIVLNGAVSQSGGTPVTLGSSSTLDIAVVGTATAVPTASNTPSVVVVSLKVLSSTSAVYAQYTITFDVY
ncbi:MAG: hypothetical protein JRN21_05095 [Nitrososphaerota archaeon]|nr:hypothetical protein [Nitrososphaerota archaeon]